MASKNIIPISDIEKVLSAADPEVRQYLIAISDTMGRVCEINRLKWDNVDLENGYLILYTRKKRGSHLTPRKVSLTVRLSEILKLRFRGRKKSNPWVFYASYQDWKTKKKGFARFELTP
jgi:integrase